MGFCVRLFLAFCIAVAAWPLQSQPLPKASPTNVLTAASILEMTPEIAGKRIPARIRGIVTCSDLGPSLFFVQDLSAGIYVYTTGALPPIGTEVEVTGVTDKGRFSPIVMADAITALGAAELPAPTPLAVEQMATGRLDAQWVEVEGVVLRDFEDWGHRVLTLGSGSSRLEVRILRFDHAPRPSWVDARVKVKGVAGTAYNDRGQFTGFHLLTQNESLVTILEKPLEDPFAAELRVSRNMLSYSRLGASEHRMRLRGLVTFYWPGRDFYIHDEAGGVRVHSRETLPLKPGDVVEVVGFPTVGGLRPSLVEAVYRKVEDGRERSPRAIMAKDGVTGEAEGEVVSIEGAVLQSSETHSGHVAVVLEANQKVFRACYRPEWKLPDHVFLVGGTIRVSGICAVDATPQTAHETFSIWLRRPEDLAVIARPPAWRHRQMLIAAVGVGGAVALGAGWVLLLRVRVRRQTAAIRKREMALEERYRDLFENSNDVIYAHDLEGNVTSMNNAGQALFGYTIGELLRMNLSEIVDPDDLEKCRAQTKAKLSGSPRTAYELRVRAKNGQRLILEVNSRLSHMDGVPTGVQGIARDITNRKKTEEALRLSERQLRASLEERERLGRDLHDGIIQSIYAAGLNLEDCAHVVTQDPPGVEKRLRKVMGDLNRVIRDVRDFIVGLERHRLRGCEFKGALKSLALTIGDAQSARVELNIDDSAAAELEAEQATQLLHIAREALSNSLRHARAQKVTFLLTRSDYGLIFEISDDGIGFNPPACEGKGFGLRNMAARARELKSKFQLVSQTGEGTRIVLDIGRETSEQSPRENPLAHR